MIRKRIRVEAAGKSIVIDNPELVKISIREDGLKPSGFNIRLDKKSIDELKRTYRRMGGHEGA